MKVVFAIFAAIAAVNAGVFVDRIDAEANPKICNATITHYDDANGDGVVNGTFQTFKTITKIIFYTKIYVPENRNDREFKREILSAVCDAEKMINGMKGNVFLKGFADVLRKSLDFEFKTPFLPVSLKFNF